MGERVIGPGPVSYTHLVAACGIPKFQMTGLAEKIYNVMKRLGKL